MEVNGINLEIFGGVWYNVTREELHKNIAYCVKEKINYPDICCFSTKCGLLVLFMILYYNNSKIPRRSSEGSCLLDECVFLGVPFANKV